MNSSQQYSVSAFYNFTSLEKALLAETKAEITALAQKYSTRGLIVLSKEGFNGTVAAPAVELPSFLSALSSLLPFQDIDCKEASSSFQPYPRMKVAIRKEIITYKGTELDINLEDETHLSPRQWHELLTDNSQKYRLVDTRNRYEVALGTFTGAEDPQIDKFTEFDQYTETFDPDSDEKILLFCTGGIRCEKVAVDLKRRGFQNVFQLKGGILNYLKEFPHGTFQGDCFVFDHRVAVDSSLSPSTGIALCPHCGDPGNISITCDFCGQPGIICEKCQPQKGHNTCSKNCRHHILAGSSRKKPAKYLSIPRKRSAYLKQKRDEII